MYGSVSDVQALLRCLSATYRKHARPVGGRMGTPAQRLESERAKYPAMQVDEILVWRNWLQLHQAEYDRFDYNLRIGTGVDPGPSFPDNIRQMAIAIRSLRLDAVGYQGGTPTIFEVKRRAGPENVGQLLTYRAVWESQQLSAAAPALVLVCSDLSQHILPIVQQSGIRLELVPTDFSFLSPSQARRRPT